MWVSPGGVGHRPPQAGGTRIAMRLAGTDVFQQGQIGVHGLR